MVNPGHRGPDALLHPPGARTPVHLFQITKSIGTFWLIVLAGFPMQASAGTPALRTYLDNPILSFVHKVQPGAFCFLTIPTWSANQAEEALGAPAFGDSYYDLDNSAHSKYGISPQAGLSLSCDQMACLASLQRWTEVGGFIAKHLPSNKVK
jgi:phenol 2-monooxygenase (NADPH)